MIGDRWLKRYLEQRIIPVYADKADRVRKHPDHMDNMRTSTGIGSIQFSNPSSRLVVWHKIIGRNEGTKPWVRRAPLSS